MKTLVIAEKPSVAGDLAKALGKVPKKGDYYENDEYVISSAVGHLVELYMPEDMSKDLKRWTLKTLPIVPKKFELKPIAKHMTKFQELKKLINRKDVGQIINACDAGREGELIFTYVNELANGKKPVKRLWMSSMTLEAIKKAFAELRDEAVMKPLQDAARSRSEADWLIGINGTRGATVQFGRRGGTAATVGRVQTPTLNIVYQREVEIRNFVPRDYWRLKAEFGIHAGAYEGVYQKPAWKKGSDEHDRADRFWEKTQAEQILAEIQAAGTAELSEEAIEGLQNQIPLGRLGEPEDVAHHGPFLLALLTAVQIVRSSLPRSLPMSRYLSWCRSFRKVQSASRTDSFFEKRERGTTMRVSG